MSRRVVGKKRWRGNLLALIIQPVPLVSWQRTGIGAPQIEEANIFPELPVAKIFRSASFLSYRTIIHPPHHALSSSIHKDTYVFSSFSHVLDVQKDVQKSVRLADLPGDALQARFPLCEKVMRFDATRNPKKAGDQSKSQKAKKAKKEKSQTRKGSDKGSQEEKDLKTEGLAAVMRESRKRVLR